MNRDIIDSVIGALFLALMLAALFYLGTWVSLLLDPGMRG